MNLQTSISQQQLQYDSVTLGRKIFVFVMFVASVVLASSALKSGNILLMVGFVSVPFLLMLISRPDISLVFAVLLDSSSLQFPGVSETSLGLVAKVVLVTTAVLAFIYRPQRYKRFSIDELKPLKLLIAVVLCLIFFRGSGLRVLGSSTWGGMLYVNLLVSIAFFMAVYKIQLSIKQIRWIAWGAVVFGIWGAIFERSGFISTIDSASEIDRNRISWLQPMLATMFPMIFAVKWKRWVAILIWVFLIAGISLSGFRGRLIGYVAISAIYLFFRARNKIQYVMACLAVGLVLWIGIILVSPYAPIGMQRTFSFIPGVTVDARVMDNASGSVEWRVEIWQYCIKKIPEYLVLGRGSAFDVSETISMIGQEERGRLTPWLAFLTRNYHSGPLVLLIDYGLTGFIAAVWLTILILRRLKKNAVQILKLPDTFEARYTLLLCSAQIWSWWAYYLIYGSVRSFSENLTDYALVIVLMNSLIAAQANTGQDRSRLVSEFNIEKIQAKIG